MDRERSKPDEPAGAPVARANASPITTINFVQDNPEGNPDGSDDITVTRHWYQVPRVGDMIWLKDSETVFVKGTVQTVTWRDGIVEASVVLW